MPVNYLGNIECCSHRAVDSKFLTPCTCRSMSIKCALPCPRSRHPPASKYHTYILSTRRLYRSLQEMFVMFVIVITLRNYQNVICMVGLTVLQSLMNVLSLLLRVHIVVNIKMARFAGSRRHIRSSTGKRVWTNLAIQISPCLVTEPYCRTRKWETRLLAKVHGAAKEACLYHVSSRTLRKVYASKGKW